MPRPCFTHACHPTPPNHQTGPDRSIIKQSYDARERLQDPSLPNHLGFGNLNGDGFGIGWYAPDELREGDPTPCMYKSITPAW
jgi:predicted glutamine amidotransferase